MRLRHGTVGETGKRKLLRWILALAVSSGIFIALFFLPDILLRQSTKPKTKPEVRLTDRFPTEAVMDASNEGASKTEPMYPVQETALSGEFSEMLPQPFEEADKNLLNKPPDWTRLYEYSMVLEFSPLSAGFLGNQQVVLSNDLLYEHALHDFESLVSQKANSALYVQVGAVSALASFLQHKGSRAFAREYLSSRPDYPTSSDFKVRQEAIENGCSRLVYEYTGGLPFEGSPKYRFLLQEGRRNSEQQQAQFIEQCAMDIAIKAMKQKMEDSSHPGSPAFEKFLKDPSERTLGDFLKEQGKVSIEIPDYDPFSIKMIDVQLKLPGISLRGPRLPRQAKGDW